MKNALLQHVENKYNKKELPEIRTGDTVRVHIKIKEGNKERIQVYEGLVIKKKEGSINKAITVRKIVAGVGVEKTFPLYSPAVANVEIIRHGVVRRASLYYLRDIIGSKAAKIKEKLGFIIPDVVPEEANNESVAAEQPEPK
jgi:large subunit ribosomal protein L19